MSEKRVNWSDYKTVELCEKGAWCEIDLPNGDPSPMSIKLIGKDSKKYKNRVKRFYDRARKKKNGFSADEAESETMEAYIACVVEWKGFYEEDSDVEMEVTHENVELVFTQCPWLYDQVVEFVNERSNFLSD
jgi:hypothetical protein